MRHFSLQPSQPASVSMARVPPRPAAAPPLSNQAQLRRLKPQAKLEIGASNDPLEHEADRAADQVLRDSGVELSAGPPRLSRQCTACAQDDEIQRKPDSIPSLQTDPADALREGLSTPGQALAPDLRAYFEPRFGQDFSAVRVHTGPEAANSASAVSARAYTYGRHLVFGTGQFSPHSHSGRQLLAHELAHVVQQTAPQAAPPVISRKCIVGHQLGVGELVPDSEKGNSAEAGLDLYYRIWGTWKDADLSLSTFGQRVVNAWIPWRFGPLAPEDRQKVSDYIYHNKLETLGKGVGEAGCDYSIVFSTADIAKLRELSGEVKRERDLKAERDREAQNPEQPPAIATATVEQRIILLEGKIKSFWTGNKDEQAILDIIAKTPDDQAAELSRRLSTDKLGDETYFDALDRVVDLGNNLELHTSLTKLFLRGLGSTKGLAAVLDNAPTLPWHDVMGLGADTPAIFSATPSAGGKILIKYLGMNAAPSNMPFQQELDALPLEVRSAGKSYDGDQIFKIHDWDESKFVVVRARDLLAYQNIGIRNWLGQVATIASFAIPGGAATTTAGKVALITIERVLPLLITALRESRLSLVKWFPTWGPRMLYFADMAELAIGLYGIANFARTGLKLVNAWREARFARKLWEAGQAVDEAEAAAVKIEHQADDVFKSIDDLHLAEPAGETNIAAGAAQDAHAPAAGETKAPVAAGEKPPAADPAKPPAVDSADPAAKIPPVPGADAQATVPVSGGHHIEVNPRGIELCSPKPCPLLDIEYAAELAQNSMLKNQMAELNQLRQNGGAPELTARLAAELRESLQTMRANQAMFDSLPAYATAADKARLAKILYAAEEAGQDVSPARLAEISKKLNGTKSAAELEQELARLESSTGRPLNNGPQPALPGENVPEKWPENAPPIQLPAGTKSLSITLKPNLDANDVRRKVDALNDLCTRGNIMKVKSPPRQNIAGGVGEMYKGMPVKVPTEYKYTLIEIADRQFGPSAGKNYDKSRYEKLVAKLLAMSGDHVQDLQLSGLDNIDNIWMLDLVTNTDLGTQIAGQLRNLPDGTRITGVTLVIPP